MKQLYQTTQFGKDVKRVKRRGKDLLKLKFVVKKLAKGEVLEAKFKDHPLIGRWNGCRDCHIEPDWLLIYCTDEKILGLERTGSHSDLFKS